MPIARALESVKNWVSCQSTLDMNEIRHVGHVIRGHVIRGELYGTHTEGYAEEHQYWNESDAVNRLWDVSGVTVHLHSSDNVLISVRLDVKKMYSLISTGARAIVKQLNWWIVVPAVEFVLPLQLDCWSYSGHSDRVPVVLSDTTTPLERVCFDELAVIVRDRMPGMPSDILGHWTVWRNWTVWSSWSRRERSRVRSEASSHPEDRRHRTSCHPSRIRVHVLEYCKFSFRLCCSVTSSLTLRCNICYIFWESTCSI